MILNRNDLLRKLLCVSPGLSKSETIQQSSCVVLRRGRFYTLSHEIACSLVSGLPIEWEAAFRANKLIDLLKLMTEEEIDLELGDGRLRVSGKRPKAWIPLESEIILPVDEVERPKGWQDLGGDFSEAVDLSAKCTKRRDAGEDGGFLRRCVHVHPDYLEACDNTKMIRYRLPSFVKEPVLVRGESFKQTVQLGFTKGCETETWLHFHNPMGLRLSVRKFGLDAPYPDLGQFFKLRGRPVSFPKGLEQVAARAKIFMEDDTIRVSLEQGRLYVRSGGADGKFSEPCKADYSGEGVTFRIAPKLLMEMARQDATCEVTDRSMRVDGGRYVFVTSLETEK